MAKAVSSTVVLVNSDTSHSVKLSNFAMCAFANKCFPMEVVICSDGWWRSWWQTIYIMPGQPVSSIGQCNSNRHEAVCQAKSQAIGCVQPTFIEAHLAPNMISIVRSLKSQINTCTVMKAIITSSNEVLIDWGSDMVAGIWKLCNSSWETVKSFIIVK